MALLPLVTSVIACVGNCVLAFLVLVARRREGHVGWGGMGRKILPVSQPHGACFQVIVCVSHLLKLVMGLVV